ncbi:BPSL0067 family protein [Massilia genomosp. 1]|uniref:BPSL0067 family protein n=1 Tax=Massilia genomosp. 1 TaxID=2609280 RepID=A0ABX0MGP5_9BURK|nr:BPSL0067 family protein [Massilia genomosp. 1]NHZ61197.1 BPSL0067 family protein [Massilia genomosp. 1]
MTYFYSAVNSLIGKKLYGDGNCALMVQHYAKLPHSSMWRAGAPVLEQKNIWPGTAIATFENGRYPNHAHNNHVAFFLKFGQANPDGTWKTFFIVEQFKGHGRQPGSKRIVTRELKALGKLDARYGDRWENPSNNAAAFSIIE